MHSRFTAALFVLAFAGPAAAACKDGFTKTDLTYFRQIEYRTFDDFTGLGQTEASRRLATRLKSEGYSEVRRSGTTVIGWLGVSGPGQPSALRFQVTGSGGRTRIEAILTVPAQSTISSTEVRAALCAFLSGASG